MNEPVWKLLPTAFTHGTQSVKRKSENGGEESFQDTHPEYLLWLSEGNIPEPADIPPAPTYQELRAAAYPSFADQFDLIYHGGTALWKEAIDAVKTEYPKS